MQYRLSKVAHQFFKVRLLAKFQGSNAPVFYERRKNEIMIVFIFSVYSSNNEYIPNKVIEGEVRDFMARGVRGHGVLSVLLEADVIRKKFLAERYIPDLLSP